MRTLVNGGALQLLSRADCLAEFERVLAYPEFALTPEIQQIIFADYRSRVLLQDSTAEHSTGQARLPKCSDRDDQKFLELAHDAQAAALVTSDKALLKLARHRLLAGRFRILTPEGLLAELAGCSEDAA